MAEAKLELEVDLTDVFKQIQDYKKSFKPATIIKSIALRNLRWTTKNFDNEGGFVGGWAALSESTKARRRGSVFKILKDTGRLRQSFDLYGTRGVKILGHKFEIGSNVEYAASHHFGDKKRNLPSRPILPTENVFQKLGLDLLNAKLAQLRAKHG